MDRWEQFRDHLREALTHLFDPEYDPPDQMYDVTGCSPDDGAGMVQSAIINVIEDLKPDESTPADARTSRIYDHLYLRFVLCLTQEETAERLGMGVRTLRRFQREATHNLARLLWEHSLARSVSEQALSESREAPISDRLPADSQPVDLPAQLRQDLASLQRSSPPGTVADVSDTVRDAVDVERILTKRYGVLLKAESLPANMFAAIHPSVLRQILIMAIGRFVSPLTSGEICLDVERLRDDIVICITGPLVAGESPCSDGMIVDLLAPLGGKVETGTDGDTARWRISVPAAGRDLVLVVDDNQDLVHFYERCVAGTRYHIVSASSGKEAADLIREFSPAAIVLDVMLPDTDGWKLLAQLRESPATCSTPIIVCSVIREEALALALGATLYLPKPVQRLEFTQALDQVLHQDTPAAPTTAERI